MLDHMEQTLTQRVARVVRTAADGRGWSQSELARQSALPVATVRRYFFTEEREITIDALAAVAASLGTSASEIFRLAEGAGEPAVKRPVARRAVARSVAPQRRDG